MFKKELIDKADDEWINEYIILFIKDNTPEDKSRPGYGPSKKVRCEFCGRNHTLRDDMCDARTEKHGSGNVLETAKEMKLQDLFDMLNKPRELILQVMINSAVGLNNVELRALSLNSTRI